MTLFTSLLLATSCLVVPSQARTLFAYEQIQLTREHVDSLPEEDARLFAFGDQFMELEAAAPARCKYVPGDGKWPSEKAWTKLTRALSTPEALIRTVPQAAVCYPGTATANEAKCQELTRDYSNSYTHIDDPTEVLSPVYQGLTCTPPSIYNSGSCTLGGYPSFVIKAATVSDIQTGINFARNDGVRFVVKNTGHDFVGKSAGHGSLSVWTHGLKDIQYFDNFVDESGYRGPAFKAGVGVQAFELYKAANDRGVVVVAGEGQTVGAMGGYILGGGHSPLTPLFGMAADNVLGFEVVTPIGEFVTANSANNQDLFWALRGGGGGTFGVITSVTIKAFKDIPVAAASWTIDSSSVGVDRFWAATKAFFDRAIANVDSGTYGYLRITPKPNGKDYTFAASPFFAPNKTGRELSSILSPYLSQLTTINVPFSPKITEYKGFYPAWQAEFPLGPSGSTNTTFGSRLFPRSNFASEIGRNLTFNVLKDTVIAGQPVIAFNIAPTLARGNNPDNAVNSAWRNTVIHAITFKSWDAGAGPAEILAVMKAHTTGTMQKWRDVSPGSGAYLNEGDRLEPNWQQSFYGDKYGRLLDIKRDMDPKDVMWAVNAVGSEGWTVESFDGGANENGKLCRVNATTVVA